MNASFNDVDIGSSIAFMDNRFDYISVNTKTLDLQKDILNKALFGDDNSTKKFEKVTIYD